MSEEYKFYEAELAQLRADRDRLADIVKNDVCRVALVELVERLETVHADVRYQSVATLHDPRRQLHRADLHR
jgi:hypothetical protein